MHGIFIVDDHAIIRSVMAELIEEMAGLEVSGFAESGEAALDGFPHATTQLALIDVSLPGMSGIDLVGHFQSQFPDVLCLMFSAHAEASYARQAMAAGARGYIIKGDPAELEEGIRGVLGGDCYLSAALRTALD